MSRSFFRSLAAVCLLTPVALPAAATGSDHPLVDRFSIKLGGFLASTDTDLRVDSRQLGIGDRINFEDTFGLDNDETSFRLGLEWRFLPRHQLSFSSYEINRSAATTVERDVQFGDLVIPVSGDVTTTFDTEVFELAYTYWAVLGERTAFGISIGGQVIRVDASVGLVGFGFTVFEEVSGDLPVPLFGIDLRQALAPRLALHLSARLIPDVEVGDASGSAVDGALGLEFRIARNLGLGAAYTLFDVDLDDEEQGFTGNLDYRVTGANLYLRLGF